MMPRLRSAAAMLLLGAAGLTLSSSHLRAQDITHGTLKRPALGGHTFLSNDFVPDPFVRSFVRQSLGVAQALDLQFPLGIVGDDTLTILEGDLSFAVLDLEYQHAVKDWLAARGRVNLRTRLGTDGTALLSEGVQVSTGFEFGWLLRLVQTDRVVLSASADVSRSSFTVVDFRQFLEDVIAQAEDPQLADQVPMVRGTGGLRFAWGASPLFGLTALVEVGYGDAARRDREGNVIYTLGTVLDFDFGAVSPVPIGVGLGYRQSSVVQQVDAESDTRSAVVRLAYTGRPDFVIALDVLGNTVRDASLAEPVKSVGALLAMRYYF
jgi:hypothetical protein